MCPISARFFSLSPVHRGTVHARITSRSMQRTPAVDRSGHAAARSSTSHSFDTHVLSLFKTCRWVRANDLICFGTSTAETLRSIYESGCARREERRRSRRKGQPNISIVSPPHREKKKNNDWGREFQIHPTRGRVIDFFLLLLREREKPFPRRTLCGTETFAYH